MTGYPRYQRCYLEQDLRRLDDAAQSILWRLDPEAVVTVPEWLPNFLRTDAHRAAWELMSKLLLILDELHGIDAPGSHNNWAMIVGQAPKTDYPLRYIADDLMELNRGVTQLSLRLRVSEGKTSAAPSRERHLCWLTESLIARVEPILDAVTESGESQQQEVNSTGASHPAPVPRRRRRSARSMAV
jgi:hypothetical protein